MKYRIEIETDEPLADMAVINAGEALKQELCGGGDPDAADVRCFVEDREL